MFCDFGSITPNLYKIFPLQHHFTAVIRTSFASFSSFFETIASRAPASFVPSKTLQSNIRVLSPCQSNPTFCHPTSPIPFHKVLSKSTESIWVHWRLQLNTSCDVSAYWDKIFWGTNKFAYFIILIWAPPLG